MIQSRRDKWSQTQFYSSDLSLTWFQVPPCPCLISGWNIPLKKKNLIHSFLILSSQSHLIWSPYIELSSLTSPVFCAPQAVTLTARYLQDNSLVEECLMSSCGVFVKDFAALASCSKFCLYSSTLPVESHFHVLVNLQRSFCFLSGSLNPILTSHFTGIFDHVNLEDEPHSTYKHYVLIS